MYKLVSAALAELFVVVGSTGCEQEGAAEHAGERIDEALEKTGDAMQDAAEKVEDKAEEATN